MSAIADAAPAVDKPAQFETVLDAARVFFRHPSPQLIFGAAFVFTTLRLFWGSWTWWDLAIAAWIVVFWPMQEWLIHVVILHWKPFRLFGKKIDLYVAHMHRKHHREPWLLEHVYVPTPTVVGGLLTAVPAFIIGWYFLFPMAQGLTALAVFFVLGSMYEWTHFIIHTGYKPKSAFYKRLWRHHRLHHFKNENYWWGVSRIGGDWLMRTSPDPAAVEKSTSVKEIIGETELQSSQSTRVTRK